MKATASLLLTLINQHIAALNNVSESEYTAKPAPGKWSKKEIIGHLIDSAQSNIRRFLVAQYEENPFIKYNQEKWVAINNYQQWETKDIIDLWYLLNKQVCHIRINIPEYNYHLSCQTESVHNNEWLAANVKHLHH